jgi:hypothetical protein
MASHIVVIDKLEDLLKAWIQIISASCGTPRRELVGDTIYIRWTKPYVPPGEDQEWIVRKKRRVRRENPFIAFKRGMLESLKGDQWKRIRWYYYCDNDYGNTIRLYDTQHFEIAGNPARYLELENSGKDGTYPDRVLVRSENIEKETKPLKKDLRKPFSGRWAANSGPVGEVATTSPSTTQSLTTSAIPVEAELDLSDLNLDDFDLEDFDSPSPVLGSGRVDVMGMCNQFLAKRNVYFQHRLRNNMPNNQLRVLCNPAGEHGCEGRTCGIGQMNS